MFSIKGRIYGSNFSFMLNEVYSLQSGADHIWQWLFGHRITNFYYLMLINLGGGCPQTPGIYRFGGQSKENTSLLVHQVLLQVEFGFMVEELLCSVNPVVS
jgi:hypothetical protein